MLQKWINKLGLDEWNITTEQINPKQVVYPSDCVESERFFIGIQPNHERLTAVIYHDRDLCEESIVHELLHIKYPSKSENWIINKTNKIMKKEEITVKRMNDINTFMSTRDNETCLVGTDEMGEEFQIWFNTIDLLEWLDIWYMKKQTKHYIEELNK